ncbi:hypothetical protein HU200_021842 [Digitaria exilis]|uniref:Protein TIFY n=1 Tax=Digitaria exilis TaxID=1010633 RepID=A0A835EYY3_9POAL|nr:hypothetical protein HU200_021842 [Digitaria exilis]
MAAASGHGRSRFAVPCGVLSRCVRAGADAGKMASAAESVTMLLMPGADVAPDVEDEAKAAPPAQAQLTIMYAGRVLVFDDVVAERAAELLRVAARHGDPRGVAKEDIPVARKASLQRFMEKRRDRVAANRPYDTAASRPSKERQLGLERDVAAWLGLGTPGGRPAPTDCVLTNCFCVDGAASPYFF